MKKFTPLFLLLSITIWAADFWQTRPFTEWNEKEVLKVETNSPWAKQVAVIMDGGGSNGGGGGSSKGGSKKGGGGASGDEPVMGSGGSAGGRGIQEVGGGGGGAVPSLTLTVSWRTALPLREAQAKREFGAEATSAPKAKKLVEESQTFYAILVSGLPGRAIRGDNEKMKKMLMENATLSVKGKDPIVATDIQSGGNEQKAAVIFIFPKTAPLSLDDKDVEFTSKVGPLMVKQKFHLKDMVFNGKLEL